MQKFRIFKLFDNLQMALGIDHHNSVEASILQTKKNKTAPTVWRITNAKHRWTRKPL